MAIRWVWEGGEGREEGEGKGENKIWWVGMFCKELDRGKMIKIHSIGRSIKEEEKSHILQNS